jgi:hypothetical protein
MYCIQIVTITEVLTWISLQCLQHRISPSSVRRTRYEETSKQNRSCWKLILDERWKTTTFGEGFAFHTELAKCKTFSSSRQNWDSPNPFTRRRVCPPPPGSGGRGTLAGGGGVGRVPTPTRGHTLWLHVRTFWFFHFGFKNSTANFCLYATYQNCPAGDTVGSNTYPIRVGSTKSRRSH